MGFKKLKNLIIKGKSEAGWAYLPNKLTCANFLQTFQVSDFVSFSFFTFWANKERKRHPKRKKSRPVLSALTTYTTADYRLSADTNLAEMSRRLINNRAWCILGQNTRTCFLCAPFLLRQKKWCEIKNVTKLQFAPNKTVSAAEVAAC